MTDESSSSTHRNWLNQALSGDREALGKLVDKHRSYLLVLARSQIHHRLQSKGDASDVVQEVAIVAQEQLPTFRGSSPAEFTIAPPVHVPILKPKNSLRKKSFQPYFLAAIRRNVLSLGTDERKSFIASTATHAPYSITSDFL